MRVQAVVHFLCGRRCQVLLGVVSSDARLAVRALRDWTAELGLPFVVPESRVRFVLQRCAAPWSSRACPLTRRPGGERVAIVVLTSTTGLALVQVQGAATVAAVRGPVYIKYNAAAAACYLSGYEGRDCGVLLQLGQVWLCTCGAPACKQGL